MSLWLELAKILSSKERLNRFEEVLSSRTDRIIPVFENMHKPHNAAAVVRTCDALGIAYAHFIEEKTDTQFSRGISKGSQNWVDVSIHASGSECFSELKKQGYVFAATCFDERAITPEQLPVNEKIAVIFGNERVGISRQAIDLCKYKICIPMFGFVDSFNISVAAGIIFYTHIHKLKHSPETE